MSQRISFTVNGKKRTVEIEGWERLLFVLRERLGLTGTKRGCDDGSCGACVVVVNGEAKRSCILPAKKLDGAEILTIEGLADEERLHPIQEALIEAGAVQCGFCIPGIAMKLYALFTREPEATDERIVEELSHHFCRCTGYEAIIEGAKLARQKMAAAR